MLTTAYRFLRTAFLSIFLLMCCMRGAAQQFTGQVVDTAGRALAFATIKLAATQQGIIADLEGRFTLRNPLPAFIEVSYLGYQATKLSVPAAGGQQVITLSPLPSNLQVVVVKATSNKLKRILNTAIANRGIHNPDKYDWYRCNVYYKMVVDVTAPDSSLVKDTSRDAREFKEFQERQHMMLTETFSKRTWQKPASLQEEIIASRMSGFQKPLFSSLVTDVLPFHSYNDFIVLNGREYNNPISKGLYQRFYFKLIDQLLQEKDTVWVIQFTPKQPQADLGGTVFVHSDGFAISHLIAHTVDSLLKRRMGIEQQYKRHDGRWFPEQLNYTVQMALPAVDVPLTMQMKGTSLIDSVSFTRDENFRFDKAHTIKLAPKAGETKDSGWQQFRPVPLDKKEVTTYVVMDSTFKEHHVERIFDYLEKLVEAKWPLGKFDINLERVYAYNVYENNRLGWGMQTNEKISKRFTVGAWAGYGTGDKAWKYGGFAEVYADPYKEFVVRASYYNDLRDPGRLQVHPEIDKNLLRAFIMNRVDNVRGWNLGVQKKFGYLTVNLAGSKEEIIPKYDYQWMKETKPFSSFSVNEASLGLRYAYGETTAPLFGKYYSSGSKYPVVYGRLNTGYIKEADVHYSQAVAAVTWQKTINRLGKERWLLIGGVSSSTAPLPISKLFAGNGFANDQRSIYTFGGMQTMLPYQYYSDRFVNFYWSHQFTKPLYRLPLTKGFSSAPYVGVAYNVLYGSMKNKAVHQKVDFSVPDNGYHEAGVMLNSIIRMKVLGMWYLGFNAGYFRHLNPAANQQNNGRFVYGLGIEL